MDDFSQTPKKRNSQRLRRGVFTLLLLTLLVVVSFLFWVVQYSRTAGPQTAVQHVQVIIPRGASFGTIQTILAENQLIHDDIRFYLLARYYKFASRLRAGEFSLRTGQLPVEVLHDLVTAKSIQHKITISEGLNAREIADILAAGNWCSTQDFLSLAGDVAFIRQLGFTELQSLEGYLFPDTYYLTRYPLPTTAEIIERMVMRGNQVWKEIGGDLKDEKERDRLVILASIVEKETGKPSERPRIAAVFYNRLEKGMRLQSDPTVIYGIPDFSGNITRKDLRRKHPYNTYVIPGLPPGAIGNPGRESLEAVLHPARENFLYFVSKNDGSHHFSRTLREHNRAVNRYQRRGK